MKSIIALKFSQKNLRSPKRVLGKIDPNKLSKCYLDQFLPDYEFSYVHILLLDAPTAFFRVFECVFKIILFFVKNHLGPRYSIEQSDTNAYPNVDPNVYIYTKPVSMTESLVILSNKCYLQPRIKNDAGQFSGLKLLYQLLLQPPSIGSYFVLKKLAIKLAIIFSDVETLSSGK